MMSESYTTKFRLQTDGFSDEFFKEAMTEVQGRLFGDWPLYGGKAGYGPSHDAKSTTYIFGQIFGRPGLDLKTRGLLVLAGLSVLQREGVVRIWTNACLNLGWTEDEIKEIGMLVAHIGGFPVSRQAVLVFDDIFEKRAANPDAKHAGA
jgi:4-carboxymuconolactone decarboxylase